MSSGRATCWSRLLEKPRAMFIATWLMKYSTNAITHIPVVRMNIREDTRLAVMVVAIRKRLRRPVISASAPMKGARRAERNSAADTYSAKVFEAESRARATAVSYTHLRAHE